LRWNTLVIRRCYFGGSLKFIFGMDTWYSWTHPLAKGFERNRFEPTRHQGLFNLRPSLPKARQYVCHRHLPCFATLPAPAFPRPKPVRCAVIRARITKFTGYLLSPAHRSWSLWVCIRCFVSGALVLMARQSPGKYGVSCTTWIVYRHSGVAIVNPQITCTVRLSLAPIRHRNGGSETYWKFLLPIQNYI